MCVIAPRHIAETQGVNKRLLPRPRPYLIVTSFSTSPE